MTGRLPDMARSMVQQVVCARQSLWADAANTARFIRNRLITKNGRENCTAFEVIQGRALDIEHLKTFGCKAFLFHSENGAMEN